MRYKLESFLLAADANSTGDSLPGAGSETKALGPPIPWCDMRDDERFAYLLPPLVFAIIGLILLAMAIQFSRTEIAWEMIGSSVLIISSGVRLFAIKWKHRDAR